MNRRRHSSRPQISGLATYVPPRLLTNADLEKLVDTSDEWILQRTGIRERHIVDPGRRDVRPREGGGAEGDRAGRPHAGRHRLHRRRHDHAGHDVSEHGVPAAAQDRRGPRLGLRSGRRLLGVHLRADDRGQMVAAGTHTHALVVGADVMSSIIDYTDRSTCVLFGDGAGAVVVSPGDRGRLRHHRLRARDRRQRRPGAVHAGRRQPAAGVARDRRPAAALREAGRPGGLQVRRAEDRRNLRAASWSATGQRRATSICSCRTRPTAASSCRRPRGSGLPPEKVIINIERYGNTTAATIPLALDDAVADGRLKKGDLVLLASVGAGFTVGAVLLRWSI